MKHLLFNLFKIIVIVSNVLPLNALVAYAAPQSASETRLPIEYNAEKIPYARPAPSKWMPGNLSSLLPKAPDAAASAAPASRTRGLPLPGNLAGEQVSRWAGEQVGRARPAAGTEGWADEQVSSAASPLPDWFNANATAAAPNNANATVGGHPSAVGLPDWFNATAAAPNNANATVGGHPSAVGLPPMRPMFDPIPQLSMVVEAPDNVSAGDEAVGGNFYTITVRNNSPSTIAYNFYIRAAIPVNGFTYVGSANMISSTGFIALVISQSGGSPDIVTFQPNPEFNLSPGEIVTLTFKMETDGDAVSGQRLDAYAMYENPAGATESYNAGQNIRVGRGNLVISKSPSIQEAQATPIPMLVNCLPLSPCSPSASETPSTLRLR